MFYCKFCSFIHPHFNCYLEHLKVHSSLNNKFLCGFDHCDKVYNVLTSLQSHVHRFHKTKIFKDVHSDIVDNGLLSEEICCTVEFCTQKYDNRQQMIKHLKMHINEGMIIRCCYSNCEKTYNKINSFSSHLTKYHKKGKLVSQLPLFNDSEDNSICVSDSYNTNNNNNDNDHLVAEEYFPNENFLNYEQNDTENVFLINLAHFFLKLEFKFLLPASTVQYIASQICEMSDKNQETIKNTLSKNLEQLNIPAETINDVIDSSLKSSLFNNIHDSLGTSFKRRKFFEEHFPYVDPVQIPLPSVNGKKRFWHYIPLKETLKNLFYNKSVTSKLQFDLPENNTKILRDFTDGTVFKENMFFKQNPGSLKLILYQDAFETVNPLGSAKSKYKILAVYLTIGNFPDKIRSHVNSIYLVALCKEKIFDHNLVFGKIVEDLKEIETIGVEFSPGQFIKGSLVFITGDNLGSHALGGFVDNFSRTPYFCRYCLIQKKSFDSGNGIFKTYPRRTIETYNKTITRLQRRIKFNVNIIKKSAKKPILIEGIKRDSAFNKLEFYHVCLPGLPPCLGHDVFEGVIAYDVKLFLDDLVKKNWFSYKLLNKRIESFKYSTEDQRDKLCTVSQNSKRISGAACQLWTFVRLLPLLINDKIYDIDDDTWKCILLLSEIVEIICAPAIHEKCILYLQIIIHDYIYLRKTLFTTPLRPKHHYLQHYPELIIHFGPLMKSWTLRCESKHCFMKSSTRFSRNFINITKSLSVKHELYQCFIRAGGEIYSDIEIKKTEKFNLSLYNEAIQQVLSTMQLHQETMQCSEILKNGISYRCGDGLFVSKEGYQYKVVVGKICIILYNDVEIHFLLEVLETEFVPYLGVYKLGKNLGYKCLTFNQLASFEKLHIYHLNFFSCVKPKFGLVEQGL